MSTENSTGVASSLRETLKGKPDPEFELDLPPGWVRRVPDEQYFTEAKEQAISRLIASGNSARIPEVEEQLRQGREASKTNDTIALFVPEENPRGTLWLPASLVATVRRPPAGATMNEAVASIIQNRGGAPLFGDKRFVRYQREMRGVDSGVEYIQSLIIYLTPFPETQRNRALELALSVIRPPDAPADDAPLQDIISMFDVVVSSLRWRQPASL